jgi:Ion channel.
VKFIFSQMAFFMAQQSNRRNMRFMLRFTLLVLVLILLYSVLFHYIMEWEDRYYSPITGLYWTLTVMSTLGFGDITFLSDTGQDFHRVRASFRRAPVHAGNAVHLLSATSTRPGWTPRATP